MTQNCVHSPIMVLVRYGIMRQHHHVFSRTPWTGKCSGQMYLHAGAPPKLPCMDHKPAMLYKDAKWHKAHPKSMHYPRPPCQEANCPPCNRSMLTVCASLQYLYFEVQCQRSLTAQHIYSTHAISLQAVQHKKVDGTGTHQTPQGAFCQATLDFQAVPAAVETGLLVLGTKLVGIAELSLLGLGGWGCIPSICKKIAVLTDSIASWRM